MSIKMIEDENMMTTTLDVALKDDLSSLENRVTANKDNLSFLEKRLTSNNTSLSTLQENLKILEKTSHDETIKICDYFFKQLKTVDEKFYETHKEIDKLRQHTFLLFTVYAAAMIVIHLFF